MRTLRPRRSSPFSGVFQRSVLGMHVSVRVGMTLEAMEQVVLVLPVAEWGCTRSSTGG